jgi:uncharacterized protein (UPF0210 family)
MKIRTITVGCEIKPDDMDSQISILSAKAHAIKERFLDHGYEVQTLRLSTQPWEQYLSSPKDLSGLAKDLQKITKTNDIDYFNIGPTSDATKLPSLYDFFHHCSTGFCTSIICQHPHLYFDTIEKTAALIKKLSDLEPDGFANLRFAALCNIPAGTPFYPASFHQGPESFGIGLENSDLVNISFERSTSIKDAKKELEKTLKNEYSRLEKIALQSSTDLDINYKGLDCSISSSVHKEESIAYAFEHLGYGTFGEIGSCAIAKIITDTLQEIPVKKIGYNGLMLPVLEDHGLSARNREGHVSIQSLLLYSSVCGTGLDTIPLPGDITKKQLTNILFDVASLSQRLRKPLSARLLPIPSKKAGDETEFSFDYFVNTIVMTP